MDDVDLQGRVEFSIQTIGEGDMCSEKCHFAITGALSTLVRKLNYVIHQSGISISCEKSVFSSIS